MSLTIHHLKHVDLPDGPDDRQVQPSDWNAALVVSGTLDTAQLPTDAALTGVPTAPTADPGTDTDQIATTAFVLANGGGGGTGSVTHTTGDLTANRLLVGNDGDDLKPLGSNGTATQVLHGNASGPASFGAVNLATDVTGTLPAAQAPALTGDVTTSAGSLATTIGAGKVTNAMLAGSIAASKLVGTDLTIAESQVTGLVSDLAGKAPLPVNLASQVTGTLPSANGGVPQALGTTATPQFARVGIGAAADSSAALTIAGQYGSTLVDDGNTGTAKTIDWDAGNEHAVTETGSCTFTFSHPKDGFRYVLLRRTGAGGFTPTFPGNVVWLGGTPTWSTAASVVDVITLVYVLAVDTYYAAVGSTGSSGASISAAQLVAPIVAGGTGTTSTLKLQPTTGVGTTGADLIFAYGNNGASEAARILGSTGFLGLGTAAPETRLHAVGTNAGTSSFTFERSNAGVGGPLFILRHTRVGAIVASGDQLGSLSFRGWDGTSYFAAADISGLVDGTPGTSDMPGRLSFSTAPDGTGVAVERMRINNAGNVVIGTAGTDPRSKLHIEGQSGWIIQDEQDTDPTTSELDADDSIAYYRKNDKLVFAYNRAGTMTYVTLPLDGSSTTLTHSTTAP